MSQPAESAEVTPDLKSSEANDLQCEHDHLRVLRRRFETAAEALTQVHGQLKARGFQNGDCPDHRKHNADLDETEPDGGRL